MTNPQQTTCSTCPHVLHGALWSVCQNLASHFYMRKVDPGADSCGLHPNRRNDGVWRRKHETCMGCDDYEPNEEAK